MNIDSQLEFPDAEQRIKQYCESAIYRKYGANPPKLIFERLHDDYEKIPSGGFSFFLLVKMIIAKCDELGFLHSCRDRGGASLIAYLLGITACNPLPPHYFCPKCRRVEFVDPQELPSGFDLVRCDTEAKKCPACGAELQGDGQSIPCELFFGYYKDIPMVIDLDIPAEAHHEICSLIETLFGRDNVSYSGSGLLITELRSPEYGYKIALHTSRMLSLLKLLETNTGIASDAINLSDINIFDFCMNGDFSGLPHPFDEPRFPKTVDALFPTQFSDLLKISGFLFGRGTWDNNAEMIAGTVCLPEKAIAFEDDIVNTLLQHGMNRETSLFIARSAKRGRVSECLDEKTEKELREHDIEDWYIESMNKILYLFPKAHAVECLIPTLRMIWYKLHFPDAFNAIVGEN